MSSKVNAIIKALKTKASAKQQIYRNTFEIFNQMKTIAAETTKQLAEKFAPIDDTVIIEYRDVNQFEFHVKFSGDLLVFTMHSNVITFPPQHVLFKSPYIQEDPGRSYFGHIMVYNFMADSIKYNRMQDPGYLIARFLVNKDKHFYIEGVRQLSFLYPDIAKNAFSEEVLSVFIESSMHLSIETDLQAPPLQQLLVITLGQKMANQMVHGGEKVGFKMQQDS